MALELGAPQGSANAVTDKSVTAALKYPTRVSDGMLHQHDRNRPFGHDAAAKRSPALAKGATSRVTKKIRAASEPGRPNSVDVVEVSIPPARDSYLHSMDIFTSALPLLWYPSTVIDTSYMLPMSMPSSSHLAKWLPTVMVPLSRFSVRTLQY